MNKAESESLMLALAEDGWSAGDSEEEADLVILNTCSVRETAEERIRGRLGFYRHAKRTRPFTLVLTGCMAERLKERITEEFPEVDAVVGTFQKRDIVSAIRRVESRDTPVVLADERKYSFAKAHSSTGVKAFVPIMHGCDNFCAYCIVPYVRGPEVSRHPLEILGEIRMLAERGVREITLLGQNVNSYRHDSGNAHLSFPGLLRLIQEEGGSIRWIRFLTSHPKDLSDELLDVMAGSSRFCRHVHLPLQSGSTRILGAMRRGYTAERYLALVETIRRVLSGASITTDILIGFPGETEEDFKDTLGLMERVGFDDAFTYHYNPREGTPAFRMPGTVPDEVKQERLAAVIEAQRAISEKKARARVGQEVEVLVEGISRKSSGELLARTEWDSMVVFPGPRARVGGFARVRLTELSGNTFRAVRV
jgi:tRNA-2-methylthio-N6-dimethylallyladenosine synthase